MPSLGLQVMLAPVLSTLMRLCGSCMMPHMRALALRLVTQLWKHQDRCFPHLQKMILDKESSACRAGTLDEVTLAKAASIRDICESR